MGWGKKSAPTLDAIKERALRNVPDFDWDNVSISPYYNSLQHLTEAANELHKWELLYPATHGQVRDFCMSQLITGYRAQEMLNRYYAVTSLVGL